MQLSAVRHAVSTLSCHTFMRAARASVPYRESLDCASALQELTGMGVENIITFDAHDARVQNATPLHGFETIQPAYQFIKALLKHEEGLHIDNEHFTIISPDEGSMRRAILSCQRPWCDMGMYYRRLITHAKRTSPDRRLRIPRTKA